MIITSSFSVILNLYLGVCVRSSPTIDNYKKYGLSDQCFEGNSGKTCVSGSKLCAGNQTAANYVYKIAIPGAYFIQIFFFFWPWRPIDQWSNNLIPSVTLGTLRHCEVHSQDVLTKDFASSIQFSPDFSPFFVESVLHGRIRVFQPFFYSFPIEQETLNIYGVCLTTPAGLFSDWKFLKSLHTRQVAHKAAAYLRFQ